MFGIDNGIIAVLCGIALAYCGYRLGKDSGVRSGIDFTLQHLADQKFIRVVEHNGEHHIMAGQPEVENETT